MFSTWVCVCMHAIFLSAVRLELSCQLFNHLFSLLHLLCVDIMPMHYIIVFLEAEIMLG